MMKYYIGLLSGTSVDAIDAAVIAMQDKPQLVASYSHPIPLALNHAIHDVIQQHQPSLQTLGELNVKLGILFADAVTQLLQQAKLSAADIIAIGSHGQTIYHHPNGDFPFSMQLGDPNVIAAKTNITTVANFRNKDIALGGQGAPLTPVFHDAVFRSTTHRVIVNIGGIANITVLDHDASV
ncbi:MAG: anhydro-N-acetylmuramic acid kinase, partial [Coxiellaceae bacterium]|nr:anhydro-N-acetylmuramic acid kinase [Coxiellaceae bacterium]